MADTQPMAAQGRIILLFLVVLFAGCGQDDTVVDADAASESSSTTTVAPTTTAVPATTADTTTSLAPATTTTVDPIAGHGLPAPFGSIEELGTLVDNSYYTPLDAHIVSFASVSTDLEYVESIGARPPTGGEFSGSATITHFGNLTVWDHDDGVREVDRQGRRAVLLAPGEWQENRFSPWITTGQGAMFEWVAIQNHAIECIEDGPEVIGLEQIAGAKTLHLRCVGGDGDVSVSTDVWIGEQGHVMKSIYEQTGGEIDVLWTWEVTSLDVERPVPLPPGW